MHEPPELIFEFGREFAEWICKMVTFVRNLKKNREYYFAPTFNFVWACFPFTELRFSAWIQNFSLVQHKF